MSATELAGPLTITLTAVVQHVRILERCGLVVSTKQGRVRTCRLRPEGISLAEGWLAERRRTWERKLDRLGTFLKADTRNQGDPQ